MDTTPIPRSDTDGDGARSRRFRRATVIGLTAGLLGGGAAGFALGVPSLSSAASEGTDAAAVAPAQDDTGTSTDGTSTDDTSTNDTAPVRGDRLRSALQPLVDEGTITAEQADAVVEQLLASMPDGSGRGHRHGHHVVPEAVADALGITTDELREAIAGGSTLAEIAEAEGVEVQVVIDAMVAEVAERLAERVDDGSLTQEQADARLAEITERITDRVNEGGGFGRMGRGAFADA